MKDYYKQLHTNKLGNLEETNKALEIHNLPTLDYKKMGTLNRPIIRRWIGNPNFPKLRSPGPDNFTDKVY